MGCGASTNGASTAHTAAVARKTPPVSPPAADVAATTTAATKKTLTATVSANSPTANKQRHRPKTQSVGQLAWGKLSKQVKTRAAFGMWTKAKQAQEEAEHGPVRGSIYLSFNDGCARNAALLRESLIKRTRRWVYTAETALDAFSTSKEAKGLAAHEVEQQRHKAVMEEIDRADNLVVLLSSSYLVRGTRCLSELHHARIRAKRIIFLYVKKFSIKKFRDVSKLKEPEVAADAAEYIITRKPDWLDFTDPNISPKAPDEGKGDVPVRQKTFAAQVSAAAAAGENPVAIFEKTFATSLNKLHSALDRDISALRVYQEWEARGLAWVAMHDNDKVDNLMHGDELRALEEVMKAPGVRGEYVPNPTSVTDEETVPSLPEAPLWLRQFHAASSRYEGRHERDLDDVMKIVIIDCADAGRRDGDPHEDGHAPLDVVRRIRESGLLSYGLQYSGSKSIRGYRIYWPPSTLLDLWVVYPTASGKTSVVGRKDRAHLFRDADGVVFLAKQTDSWTRLSEYITVWIGEMVKLMHVRNHEVAIFSRGGENAHMEEVDERDEKPFPNSLEESGQMRIPVVSVNKVNICKTFNQYSVIRVSETFYHPGRRTPAELWIRSIDVWHYVRHHQRIMDMSVDARKKLSKLRRQPVEMYSACIASIMQVPKVLFTVWATRQRSAATFDSKVELFLHEFEVCCQWLGAFRATFERVGVAFPPSNASVKAFFKLREKSKATANSPSFKVYVAKAMKSIIDKDLWPRVPRLTRQLIKESRVSRTLPRARNIALEKQSMIKGIKDKNVLRILGFLGSKSVSEARLISKGFNDTITTHKETQRHLLFFDDVRACASRIAHADSLRSQLLKMEALVRKTKSLLERVTAHATMLEESKRARANEHARTRAGL